MILGRYLTRWRLYAKKRAFYSPKRYLQRNARKNENVAARQGRFPMGSRTRQKRVFGGKAFVFFARALAKNRSLWSLFSFSQLATRNLIKNPRENFFFRGLCYLKIIRIFRGVLVNRR